MMNQFIAANEDTPFGGSKWFIRFRSKSDSLYSINVARNFVENVIVNIHMRILGRPLSYDVPLQIRKQGGQPFHDEGGISVVSVLSTSHVAIHTWPALTEQGTVNENGYGWARLDVDSCRPFGLNDLLPTIMSYYNPNEMHIYDLSGCLDESTPDENIAGLFSAQHITE